MYVSVKVSNVLLLTETPKSGEVEHQIAPKLDVASMASTANAQLGRYPEYEGKHMWWCNVYNYAYLLSGLLVSRQSFSEQQQFYQLWHVAFEMMSPLARGLHLNNTDT